MRVKVGDTWYDSTEVAICLQVNPLEQGRIAILPQDGENPGQFAVFPDADVRPDAQKREWMADPRVIGPKR